MCWNFGLNLLSHRRLLIFFYFFFKQNQVSKKVEKPVCLYILSFTGRDLLNRKKKEAAKSNVLVSAVPLKPIYSNFVMMSG